MLQDLWAGRELAWGLAVRDISAQYRQSALGVLWSILIDALNAPLLQVTANKALLAKINFPREALIVSGVYQTLFEDDGCFSTVDAAGSAEGHAPLGGC